MNMLQLDERITIYPESIPSVQEHLTDIESKSMHRIKQLSSADNGTIEEMAQLLCQLMVSQLQLIGLATEVGVPFDNMKAMNPVSELYGKWLDASASLLEQYGFLEQFGNKRTTTEKIVFNRQEVWAEWEQKKEIWKRDPDKAGHVKMVEATLKALPDIIAGRVPATDIIFPGGTIELVQGVYKNNLIADLYNDILVDSLIAYIEARIRINPAVKLRIIEIGAGTGATSAVIFQKLRSYEQHIEEYCYTDLSGAFLIHGEKMYGADNPFLTFAMFDIALPIEEQGIRPDAYDIAIAANVIHATKNVRESIRNVKSALKHNGLLLLNEISGSTILAHLTFGLLEGWWLYEDAPLRISGSPAVQRETWKKVLTSEGFRFIDTPDSNALQLGQQIILAESDGVIRYKQPRNKEIPVQNPPMKPNVGTERVVQRKSLGNEELLHSGRERIKQVISETLGIEINKLNTASPLSQYGIDSLVVIQLTTKLREVFTTISSTLFFEYDTIDALSEYLLYSEKEAWVKWVGVQEETVNEEPQVNGTATSQAIAQVQIQIPVSLKKKERIASAVTPSVQVSEEPCSTVTDIAIIGITGRFPKAGNVQEFWRNLYEGTDCIVEIPEERWDKERYTFDQGNGKAFCKWGGFIEDVDKFDPLFFNISPREAELMDPQDRLFLETAWNLFEETGYTRDAILERHNGKVGVFVGAMYQQYHLLHSDLVRESAMALSSYSSIANRVSYFFDLQGPSIAIDTACSSSTVAVHMACESLRRNECEMAIAGGINLSIHPKKYVGLSLSQMLASNQDSRSFSQGDGFLPAEAVGAVLLKPLSQAIQDGDAVIAVIKSTATNHGGHSHGYAVPNVNAQAELIESNFKKSGIDPRTISYAEAAANGSALGDPIEVRALTKAFQLFTSDNQYCAIGSVKSNIGHAEAASGITQLIKVALQLQHRKLVPSIKATPINPNLNFLESPFYLQETVQDWVKSEVTEEGKEISLPLRATISSFGAGGSNAHLIIEEYQQATHDAAAQNPDYFENNHNIIVLSARNKDRLRLVAERMLDYLRENPMIPLEDVAYTLQVGREAMNCRLAVIVQSQKELVDALLHYLNGNRAPEDNAAVTFYEGNADDQEGTAGHLLSGRVGEKIVKLLIEEHDVEKIAYHWTRGGRVPWKALHEGKKRRIVSLPTYPFERRRCWVADQQEQAVYTVQSVAVREAEPLLDPSEGNADLIEKITRLIAAQLGLEVHELDPQKTLTEYGLDSILILQILQQLQSIVDPEFTLDKLQSCRSVNDIVGKVNPIRQDSRPFVNSKEATVLNGTWGQFPELIRLNQSISGRPVFWIHGGLGGVGAYRSLAQWSERPFFGIQARGFMTDRYPLLGIQAIAAYYVHIIQTVQPVGPYDLGGYSLGGVLAYEITRQLQELEQKINTIVMLDAPCGYTNLHSDMNEPYVTPTKTLILQAINMSFLSGMNQETADLTKTLIHRDEVDASLNDEQYTDFLIELAKSRGLNKSSGYLHALIKSNIKLQPTYQRDKFPVYPLIDPQGVECFYFKNKSGIFMGELEPYFVADPDSPSFDHRNYWAEWSKVLVDSEVIDVDSPNHMMMLSDQKSFDRILEFCKRLYKNREG